MEITFRSLNGNLECDYRRKKELNLKTEDSPIRQFAGLQKNIIKKAIRGDIAVSDIALLITEAMKVIDFKSERTRELKTMDAIKRCERLVNEVLWHMSDQNIPWTVLVDLPERDITIQFANEPVVVKNVRPDMVVLWRNHIDAYIIRTGKAVKHDGKTFTQSDADQDKVLYALMKYTEQLVPTGQKTDLTAGYAFLRKRSDAVATKKTQGKFDRLFFTDDGMNQSDNIVQISESYVGGSLQQGTLDKSFEQQFDQFIEGIDKEDCTEEQCAGCEFNEICHYEHAPVKLEEVKKGVDIGCIQLSPIQEQIELFRSGYAVVNAVPGAGKTLVLVLRIITMLLNGVNPQDILIITFTNSGAEVFKNRIAQYNEDYATGKDTSLITATTFNGLGQMILEKEYQSLGFSRPPRVIDPVERSGIIARMLNDHPVEDLDYRNFTANMKNCKGPLAVASAVFALMKKKGYTVFDADRIASDVGYGFCSKEAAEELAELYDEYNAYLKEQALIEFDDQEVMVLEILAKDPYYFDQFGWKHILVDECQDTSENQFKLLKYMTTSPDFESLMVVGDDSQSIYGFRDTSPKYFINFEKIMGLPEGTAHQFFMVDNFRSTPEIIDYANEIISKNWEKVAKDIVTGNPSGKPVVVKGFLDQKEEYDWIANEIQKLIDGGTAPEDIAFIAYGRAELLKMADRLTLEDIPSVMMNPEQYLSNSRVKAGLALAKYFQNPEDTKDILICLNAFFGGDLFSLTNEQILEAIEVKKQEAIETKALPEEDFRKKYFEILYSFDEDDEIYQSFIDTLSTLPTMAHIFTYCNDFELYGEKAEKRRERNYPGVVLTTAHSSKGMEWPVVFNSLTKYDTPDLHTRNQRDQEEERRRLLFVSATRARKELYVTGTYVAFGPKKDRHYNMFLKESFDVTGQDFNVNNICALYHAREVERRKKKEAEKKKLQEDLLKKISKEAS